MSSQAVSRIARPPQMRRLFESQTKRTIIGATIASFVGGFIYKYSVGESRKTKYAEFYRNYDAEKEFHIMREKGVFNSCK